MSEPKDMSNAELSALLAEYAAIGYALPGGSEMAPNLAEAARRLAALPRIYDVSKGERPGDDEEVLEVVGDLPKIYIIAEGARPESYAVCIAVRSDVMDWCVGQYIAEDDTIRTGAFCLPVTRFRCLVPCAPVAQWAMKELRQ